MAAYHITAKQIQERGIAIKKERNKMSQEVTSKTINESGRTVLMQTRDVFLSEYKEELGEREFKSMFSIIDNEYYALIEKDVKEGRIITQEVYDSLAVGQRFHFNKHYNHRGDKVRTINFKG